jgi:hypothetical protein
MKLAHGGGFSRSWESRKPDGGQNFALAANLGAKCFEPLVSWAFSAFAICFAVSKKGTEFCLCRCGKAFWQQSKRNPGWPELAG